VAVLEERIIMVEKTKDPDEPQTRTITSPTDRFSSHTDLSNVIGGLTISGSLNRLSNAETGNVQEIAAAQMEILSNYYSVGIEQSNRSFKSASIAAGAGLIFFIVVIAYSI